MFGTYEGAVSVLSQPEEMGIWQHPLGGFPFAVEASDIDGDGRAEVFASAADGWLHAFRPDGELLWTFGAGYPV